MFGLTRLLRCFSVVSKQKTLLLLGAPGVKRGTYGQLLQKDLNCKYFSMQHEMRRMLEGPVGVKLDQSKVGADVFLKFTYSDKLAEAVAKIINEPQSTQGIILDGFPKTQGQLDKYLEFHPVHCALNLTVRTDVLVQRSLGRQVCQKCQKTYNTADIQRDGYSIEPILPQEEGICDECGEKLTVPIGFTERYEVRTRPILQSLDKQGLLINYEVKDTEKDYPAIRRLVAAKMTGAL